MQGGHVKKHSNWDDNTNWNANKIIIIIVVFVVFAVIDTITAYKVATSDLPFWVKYWLLK